MQTDRKVFLFDGVPVGLSLDLAIRLGMAGNKILAAVKTPDGKYEHEFIRQVRKSGADGFAISPTEKSAKGLADMLDAGFGRYGRINSVVFFRQVKAETAEACLHDLTEKTLPALFHLLGSYTEILTPRSPGFPAFALIQLSHLPPSSDIILPAGNPGSFSGIRYLPFPSKKNPFLLSEDSSDLGNLTDLTALLTS